MLFLSTISVPVSTSVGTGGAIAVRQSFDRAKPRAYSGAVVFCVTL
jgi:hypothetical protein